MEVGNRLVKQVAPFYVRIYKQLAGEILDMGLDLLAALYKAAKADFKTMIDGGLIEPDDPIWAPLDRFHLELMATPNPSG